MFVLTTNFPKKKNGCFDIGLVDWKNKYFPCLSHKLIIVLFLSVRMFDQSKPGPFTE